jgi:PII-like signaling protein
MEAPRDAVLLGVFIGEAERKAGRALYRAIIQAAFDAGLAGAAALHGPLSYGQRRHVNSEFNGDAPGNLPMVVEIVNAEAKIDGFLPELDRLMGSGLVTMRGQTDKKTAKRLTAPPLLMESKVGSKFLPIVRLYRKTASHFSGRTLAAPVQGE